MIYPIFLDGHFPFEPPAAIEAPQELTPAMPSDAEEEPEESIATWLQCAANGGGSSADCN